MRTNGTRSKDTLTERSLTDRPTILVADDDFDVRELLRFLLESEGYEVITVGNGYEALGAAMLRHPDLVILDVMMPGENGYLVSRALHEHAAGEGRPSPPVILLTARNLSADPERERAFLELSGADLTIYKPFDCSEVLRRVNETLGARPKEAESKLFPRLRWREVQLDARDHGLAADHGLADHSAAAA
ncbi:MAG TPA: response regulator [Thermoanaerobaculia bacterium]|jgi:DNA-binding response OmpR family regulator